MKQLYKLASDRIDPTQVRPLVQIAPLACERQILHCFGTAVLPSNYVLDMVC